MTDHWFHHPCPNIEVNFVQQAREYQLSLTKPAGSLGTLEDIAVSFCGWQKTLSPVCDKIQICIFAADHGVCQQGVSAFPQEVTAQMILNFINGGAAISVLAKELRADFQVINMGLITPVPDADYLVNSPLAAGTADFSQQAAMSRPTMHQALTAGRQRITDNEGDIPQLFIGGDMGIGNTSAASAIYSALLNLPPKTTVGPGTGIDDDGIIRKQRVLSNALALHRAHFKAPEDVLQRVGGLEIAGLVGAYIASAQQGTPILVDGFIASAAALLAARINPSSRQWMMFAHQSAEPAHHLALESMEATALLKLGMRLGEGSGAAIAVPLIQNAIKLHNEMATFAKASVSEST